MRTAPKGKQRLSTELLLKAGLYDFDISLIHEEPGHGQRDHAVKFGQIIVAARKTGFYRRGRKK